jgi:hypothetical protein
MRELKDGFRRTQGYLHCPDNLFGLECIEQHCNMYKRRFKHVKFRTCHRGIKGETYFKTFTYVKK